MKKRLTLLCCLVAFSAGIAHADEDCFVPMADWQPKEAVAKLAKQQGWKVRRIKIDDGCYQIDGRDAKGRAIEATVHPKTLQVIEVEFEEGDDKDDDNDDDEENTKGENPNAEDD